MHELRPSLLSSRIAFCERPVHDGTPIDSDCNNLAAVFICSNIQNICIVCFQSLDQREVGCIPDLELSRRVAGEDGTVFEASHTPHISTVALSGWSQAHGPNVLPLLNVEYTDRAIIVACHDCVKAAPGNA